MAKRNLVIVWVSEKHELLVNTFGDKEKAARDMLGEICGRGLKAALLNGVELPFEHGIIIGAPDEESPKRTRKRRAKPDEPQAASANGTTFTPDGKRAPAAGQAQGG